MSSNGRPAACHGIGAGTVFNSFGKSSTAVSTEECIPAGIESIYLGIYGVNCVVVTTLSVFGLVEDGGINDFYFSGTQVTLEVLHIVVCVPQTPFYIGK